MTQVVPRKIPSKRAWELEQQGLHPLLARIYAARNIRHIKELDYSLQSLLPPEQLMNATKAAQLLADAISAKARLLIVADYDCDGATACALGIRALRSFGATVDYLVPDRLIHGYGLSPSVVAIAAQRTPDLIITVDNGIASIDGINHAQTLGIKTLITDHHLPGETLPAADCIVNPNQPDCQFTSKCMAGVGVMFYVMLALRSELRHRGWFTKNQTHDTSCEPKLASLLDLVALGTIADVVPLDHNNRILVQHGLKRMREGKSCPGITALFQASGRRASEASTHDIGFMLAPRLNAAGRLSDMSIGIECLITDDPARALNIAQELDALNKERRHIEAQMQEQALQHLDQLDIQEAAGIALFNPDWHPGVVGIIASRIKDRLHRPVFAFARTSSDTHTESSQPLATQELRGSGRSIPGLHLRDTLDLIAKRSPGLLKKFGGHAAAAGVSINEEDFPDFCNLFAAIVDECIDEADRTQTLYTDGTLESAYFSLDMARCLDAEVWGQAFPAPLFEGEFHVESQRILKEKHLKLRLRSGQQHFDAIQFNFKTAPADKVHIAYKLSINEYNGIERLQLLIEHLEPRYN